MESQQTDFDQDGSNSKLAGMAQIFNLLGTDCKKNITIIVEQTCSILDGECSLYHRIDDKQNHLIVWKSHSKPHGIQDHFDKKGHICREAATKGKNKPLILPNLEETPYFKTDPTIKKYNLKSYLGFPVRLNGITIGSLSIVDTKTRNFCDDEIYIIQTLATALSLEEERLNEKKIYKILVESANDAIYIMQDGQLKFTNPRSLELTGYDTNTLERIDFLKLVHPEDRQLLQQNHIRRLNGDDFQSTYSFRLLDKNQKTKWVQINAVRIIWEGRPAVLGCLRDISRIKELESKLLRAEKMELIGTMAGGVAHDLNNILSGLVSYPELILMQLPDNSPLKEPISFMHDAGLKAADIVQDLLTLTRRGIQVENIINLNNIVHEYLNSAAHTRLEKNYPNIRFRTDSEADLLNICGSPSHISKIIMNLVINAAEAIKDKGTVKVKSYNQYIDIPLSGYDTIQEGDYVVLRVTDDGGGIPQKDINRIFEPFYTNKQMGRSGSGLGLSVVWNCVKDHNGYIEIRSTKNNGTVFELYFPATRKDLGNIPDDFEIDLFKGNGETVLVIDDIEEQRKIAQDSLKLLGYTPFSVASGEKAIAFIKINPVDLLLLDMKMEPGIDGLETYTQILRFQPNQRAIIASGFSESIRVKKMLQLGAGQYIKKPYTFRKLAYALKKELAV